MTLLERERALDTLDRALAATTAGHGHTVVVSGEAGIGKTALLRVFAEHVTARPPGPSARLLWGGCDPLFTPRPLGPLHDVSLQSSGPLRAALRENAARETVFAEALAELSRAATVLVLEDLHWADEATLDLLRFIGRRVERLPLLLIVTFRSDELPARRRLFAVLGELPVDLTTRITLSPLSKSAVDRLAAERAFTRRDLHALTGGNPLLVSELLAAGGDSLPETVRDAALARVARLSDPARAAVETLCVLPAGMRESWREALGVPSEALDECLSSGIMQADRTTIAFRHELTRQSIESTLPEPRRQRLHRAVLGSLASIPDGTVPLSVLVHHALHGNDSAAVLAHAPRAAEQAVLAGANREAAALYAIALEHARAMSPAARAALLEAAAKVQLIAGTPGVEQHAMEALELFRAAADRLGEGRMLLWLARWWWFSSDRERRDSALANATRILENQSESAELATAYNYRASMHMVQEEYPEAIDWATRGLALAERVGNTEAAIYALNTMGSSLLGAGRTEEGVAALERSLELALGRPGTAEDVARACTNLWVSLAECGEIARGARYLEQGLDYSVKRDLDGYVATLLAERVGLRARRGELTGALEDAVGLHARFARHPYPRPRSVLAENEALARLRRDPAFPASAIEKVANAGEANEEPGAQLSIAELRAEFAWLRDDLTQCASAIERVLVPVIERVRKGSLTAARLGPLALWLWRCGRLPAGLPAIPPPWSVEIAGDFRGAAEAWAGQGCRYDQALALLGGDQAAVRDSLALLESMGAEAAADKARRRLREMGVRIQLPGPRASTRSHPAGLTRREARVLELLSEGRTNAEIARTLVRSEKTVEHHVSAILAKLGAATRTEAASIARRFADK